MAIDHRIGTKINKNLRREEVAATRVDPHPYIGIVKNNVDPAKSGRLQVWIPDFGGDSTNSSNWRTVSYASPFMGSTHVTTDSADNTFTNVPHTYGMWMVPPDLEVEVIVIFIAGDPLKGFWLACVNSHLSRFMMPGLASSANTKTGIVAPVTEFNAESKDALTNSDFTSINKPVHEPQYNILKEQGLDKDTSRGTITSSSQRESPSNVFGISTPGRPYYANPSADPAVNPDAYLANLASGKLTEDFYKHSARLGGHTFVMDDGNILGKDQLVRLRTANGHQLMMNDTDGTLYISHGDGTSWIELTADGSVNIFANNGFNLRSKGTLNLHSDHDVNINAKNNLNLYAGGTVQADGGTIKLRSETSLAFTSGSVTEFKSGKFNIDATALSFNSAGAIIMAGSAVKMNSGAGSAVNEVKALIKTAKADTSKSASGLYESIDGKITSIATILPTHEPFNRGEVAKTAPAGYTAETVYTAGTDATKSVSGTGIKTPAGDKELRMQPPCDCTIGSLTSDQLTAYYAQIGKSESGGNYTIINSIGFIGKYQFGWGAMVDMGYIKSTCRSNAKMTNPNNWIGKNGINSLDEFLANHAEQENAICTYTKMNYKTMVRINALQSSADAETIGGMLAVSHLLGPGGAKDWRNGKGGVDQYGTTGSTYYQKGKYAIAVLAPKMPSITTG